MYLETTIFNSKRQNNSRLVLRDIKELFNNKYEYTDLDPLEPEGDLPVLQDLDNGGLAHLSVAAVHRLHCPQFINQTTTGQPRFVHNLSIKPQLANQDLSTTY